MLGVFLTFGGDMSRYKSKSHAEPDESWDYKMILKEGEMLKNLLGDIYHDCEKMCRFFDENTLTLYSKDNYEAVTIVFTPKGQVLRHYYYKKEAVIENNVRILNVWQRCIDKSLAVNTLTNEVQKLLDIRYSQRFSQKRLF
jgi:hypothetical protein